jgi:uncharacterized membrane protein YgaE (UPF0421/DUF939 family)
LLLFFFFPSTSPFFYNWRAEWAVVTVIAVNGPNFAVGYINGIYRIIGTIAGALWAIVAWYACGTNPFGLWFMSLAFVAPLHYFCFSSRHASSAFVSVLTLLLVLLSKKLNVDLHTGNMDEIYVLAYKRAVEGEKNLRMEN